MVLMCANPMMAFGVSMGVMRVEDGTIERKVYFRLRFALYTLYMYCISEGCGRVGRTDLAATLHCCYDLYACYHAPVWMMKTFKVFSRIARSYMIERLSMYCISSETRSS